MVSVSTGVRGAPYRGFDGPDGGGGKAVSDVYTVMNSFRRFTSVYIGLDATQRQ
jgi:hypothetical protein